MWNVNVPRVVAWSLVVVALVAALALSGCSTVSDEVKTQIQHAAAVGDGELADWDRLTDDNKKECVWKFTRAFHDVDFSLFGTPIPEQYKTDPWAKPATGGGK